ncbi:MAG: SurA N-terminal domain-containing protein, partial [Acidobacteriota bacterium]|nr:SurA N-terminal domain-containing protein [Acidobacteriota bacterium]
MAMTKLNKRTHRFMPVGALVCMLPLALPAVDDRDAQPPDGIAAHVNGDPITMEQLEETMQSQIEQMNQQLQQIKRSMLDSLINNMLLEQAARAEGLDLNEYLKIKVESLAVSDEEVDAAYSKSRHRFP